LRARDEALKYAEPVDNILLDQTKKLPPETKIKMAETDISIMKNVADQISR
jgi:hypothetical protein